MKIDKEWLENHEACNKGIKWFNSQKETNPIKIIQQFIEKKHLDWANWLIVRIMNYKQCVSYAIYAAEQVLNIYEIKYFDKRPRKAIEAAKECLKIKNAANAAAAAAAAAAYAAAAAAYAAAYAADTADAYAYAAAAAAANAAYAAAAAAANAAYAVYAGNAAAYAAYAGNAAAYAIIKIKILNYGLKKIGK